VLGDSRNRDTTRVQMRRPILNHLRRGELVYDPFLGSGTTLKEAAVLALLSSRNVEEAARAAGVNPRTLYRWMKEPEFDGAYREAKHAAESGKGIAINNPRLRLQCDECYWL
jgi:hypothetical protein